uniref:DNA topoisomerase (ATP-hydrolyzing) n=1 Tax=viral metagenome TaxID=1070528 RepID=A0A6C0I6M6_9ZZZZ
MTTTDLSSKYQKMTDLEHILKKPDTYIGSIQLTECTEYTALTSGTGSETSGAETSIGLATFTHIPALYKLVDEGLVNMRDHVIRQAQAIKDGKPNALPVTCIEVEVDAATGTITMTNDGNGIDIAQHPEHKMWIPEMIFGHLRTSTNYAEDKKEKIVGGKNGFGFKLVLVWSTWGSVETVDHVRGLKYIQEFRANLTEICPPKISKCTTKKPYTRISFRPDYARLGIAGLSPDMTALFMKRVYDIAAVTDRSIRVKYNGTVVPVKDFKQYIGLYIRPEVKRVYEAPSERWEYAVCLTNTDEFTHVSFVNGICTSKGGKHVEYIMSQLLRKLAVYIKTKKKVDVKPATIKEQLTLFLRCDVENPAFSSQTKDELTTTSANFGSACTVSDEFVEKVAKMGVMDAACALTEVKEAKAAKKTDGAKTRTIRGIPKLIDANFAGTEKSGQCTIIFCEGDSAKAGIVSGLSKEDRNTIGVYPVKGKFMNVRGEAVKRIAENTEIAEIKRILGLENGRDYTAEDVAKRLRYGKVLFMTDQDLDGSHIKGLGINLFQSEWPTLTHIPGFIGFMNTPILKARKGQQERLFYNEGEFEAWKSGNASGSAAVDVSTWNIKYYKGLGTSTGREFREYFEHKKIVDFAHTGEQSDDAIDLVFNKKRANDRKEWLSSYNRADHLDTSHKQVSYEDFMTREMKHFSIYDNQRSIANGMDGLKISLRKILFAAFKKGGLKTEIKVAQFSGYVSEHSGYHHGEASLNAAIIGMAQNFVGSNNINLFEPNGQYGTRLCGGRDSASERYIFTQLNAITRLIYRAEDDAVLEYLDDDGQLVEPTFYAPIVPMILVNGTKGIGTGFSTDIMCHNPMQVIDHIQAMLLKKPEAEWGTIEPYYRGFKGTIAPLSTSGKFLVKGLHTVDAAKKQVRVTELPVGHWTEDFKKHLESLIESGAIKDYVDMSTDTVVDFTIAFPATADFGTLTAVVDHGTALEKLLKLYTTESTSNMHLFDSHDQLKKYGNVRDIVRDYYATRLDLYGKRKTHQLAAMMAELLILTNKARYIQELLDGSIDLRRKRSDELTAMLQSKGYDQVEGDEQYKYLLKLPMDSVSEENVLKLLKEKGQKEVQHSTLEGTSIEQLWLADLAELRAEYVKQEEKRVSLASGSANASTGASAKKIVKAKKA